MYFNIKCIGKFLGLTNEFERSLVFETGKFERPKFDCTIKVLALVKKIAHDLYRQAYGLGHRVSNSFNTLRLYMINITTSGARK